MRVAGPRAKARPKDLRSALSKTKGDKEMNDDAPKALPTYDPESLIIHIKTLNMLERDELLDQMVDELSF